MTDTPNPFDDTSVQQVNAFDSSGAYGDNDAYEVDTTYEVNSGPPPAPSTAVSTSSYDYGKSEESTQFGDQNETTTGSNIQAMSVEHSQIPDDQLKRTCGGYSPGFLWAWSSTCAGLLGFAGIFDLFLGSPPSFLQIIVDIYLIIIGCTLLFVEIPNNCINDKAQMRTYKWARMLRRAWGKAFIYFFFAILCCTDQNKAAKTGCGVVVIFISIGIWFIGWQTARILKAMVNRTIEGTEMGTEDFDIILERKFRQLNGDSDKKQLTSEHIFALGKECGYWLNSTEVWLIAKYWDDDADGVISLIDWKYGFRKVMSANRFCLIL